MTLDRLTNRVFAESSKDKEILPPIDPAIAAKVLPTLSPFAAEMLRALRLLTDGYKPHPCGGFTTDDMEWRLGTAFTLEETLSESIEELNKAGLICYAGYDEEDGIGHCYEITEAGRRASA